MGIALAEQRMTRATRTLLITGLALIALLAVGYFTRPTPAPAPVLPQHSYETALRASRAGDAGAARLLYQQLSRSDLADTARVALYATLPSYPSTRALAFGQSGLNSPTAPVRLAALDALAQLTEGQDRARVLGPLLDDPDLTIRYQAAKRLMDSSPDDLGVYFTGLQAVIDDWGQALQAQNGNVNAQLELARVRLHQGQPKLAAEAAQHALALSPDTLQARVLLARALDKLGQPDAAREALAAPLREHPDDAFLQHELGLWLLDHGQPEYALLALARAVELAPNQSAYRIDLATSLHRLDQPEAAQAQLDQLVRRQPANRRARVLLMEYWKAAGQLQNVQMALAVLEQQNPDDPLLQQELKAGPLK